MTTDIARLGIAVDSRPVTQGTVALDQLGDQAMMTERQTTQATTQINRNFSTTARATQDMDRGMRAGAGGTRMLAMQLSQVAQQGQATGNYLQAFAIQAADIGMAFGTVGIAAGVAVGALTPLIGQLLRGTQEARDFETVMEELGDVMDGIERDSEVLQMSISELSAEYGTAAMRARELALAAAEYRVEELNDQLSDQVSILSEVTREFRQVSGTAFQSGTRLAAAIANIADQFGVTRTQARELEGLFRDLDEAATFDDQQAALVEINEAFERMGVQASDIPRDLRAALLQMIEFSNESDRAAAAAERLEELAGVLNFDDAAASAARMAENLGISLAAAQQIVALGSGGGRGDPRQFGGGFLDWRTRNVPDSAPSGASPSGGGGSAQAAQETTAAYRMAQQAIRQAQQAAVTFADVQAELDTLLESGAITAEEYADALAIARDRLTEASEVTEFWQDQARTLKDGLLDAIVAGDSLSDTFENIARSIARAAFEAALFGEGPLSGGMGGGGLLGGLLGGIFGGGRASGGPVSSGRTYLVGEDGPELFAPGASGQIIPNHALGGSRSEVTVRLAVPKGVTVEESQQIAGDVAVRVVGEYDTRQLPDRVSQIQSDPRVKY